MPRRYAAVRRSTRCRRRGAGRPAARAAPTARPGPRCAPTAPAALPARFPATGCPSACRRPRPGRRAAPRAPPPHRGPPWCADSALPGDEGHHPRRELAAPGSGDQLALLAGRSGGVGGDQSASDRPQHPSRRGRDRTAGGVRASSCSSGPAAGTGRAERAPRHRSDARDRNPHARVRRTGTRTRGMAAGRRTAGRHPVRDGARRRARCWPPPDRSEPSLPATGGSARIARTRGRAGRGRGRVPRREGRLVRRRFEPRASEGRCPSAPGRRRCPAPTRVSGRPAPRAVASSSSATTHLTISRTSTGPSRTRRSRRPSPRPSPPPRRTPSSSAPA